MPSLHLFLLLSSVVGVSCAWRSVNISNVAFRETTGGGIVGAQDGNIANAKFGGEFVLVGMSYGDCVYDGCKNESEGACGFGAGRILVWTSPDLSQRSWSEPTEIMPAAERPTGIYFRPHLVFNPATAKWVLWVRWLPPTGPSLFDDNTTYLTATSPSPLGPFALANSNVSMFWPNSADDSLFVDSDAASTGYIVHTARSTGTKIVVERLTRDFTACAGAHSAADRSGLIGPGGTESPVMFRLGAIYYVAFAPLCCYCSTGSASVVYASSTGPLGAYAQVAELGNAPGAQQNFVLADPSMIGGGEGGTVLWSGNRWGSDPSGRGLFDNALQYWQLLPITVNGSIGRLSFFSDITLNVSVG